MTASCIVSSKCHFIGSSDARTLIDHARIEAQNHRFTFDEVCCNHSPLSLFPITLKSNHILYLLWITIHNFTSCVKPIGVEALTQSTCDLALGFGEGQKKNERKMSRPFGVALLMAGFDEKGAQLYFSDPSGTYLQYKAKAIGAGSEGAQATLQDKYRDDMTLQDAEDLACEILKQVMEEKIGSHNIEVASVTAQGFHILSVQEVEVLIRRGTQ